MRYILEMLSNRVLWIGVGSWFSAQFMKIILTAVIEKRWDFSRLFFGLGGMPSSHSAVVCGLATAVGIAKGFYSVEFAMCVMLAFIVMTDAAGVRRSAGKQAAVLNKIIQDMVEAGEWPTTEKLKEMLGHTPFQVIIGGLLGILIALLFM